MKRVEVVLMGVGGVGREVLKCFANEFRQAESRVDGVSLDLMAISDTSGVVNFNEGASAEQIRSIIALKENGGHLDGIPVGNLKGLNGGHKCIVVDATSSAHTTPILLQAVRANCGVVSANKIPFARSYEDWETLSHYPRCRYNTTLGGPRGIPYELKTLRRSGVTITKIEMAVNGTVNFGFYDMARTGSLGDFPSFDRMMAESMRRGLPESDARMDFNGSDFVNKSLIAGREAFPPDCLWAQAGTVDVTPLLPPEILGSSAEAFKSGWGTVVHEYFRTMTFRHLLEREPGMRKHAVYMATLTRANAEVNLHHFGLHHPIVRNLYEEDIVVAVYTEGRPEPIIFKGPGAGAKATAARVWSDIIEVAQMM